MLPSEDLGIVVLTNGQPQGLAESVSETFMNLAEFGQVQRDWFAGYQPLMASLLDDTSVLANRKPPARPTPAKHLSSYTGTYRNAYYGTVSVTAKGKTLTMRIGPKRRAFRLTHWSGDRWSYVTAGENGRTPAAVDFRGAGATKAGSVRIENLDANGLGTLKRVE